MLPQPHSEYNQLMNQQQVMNHQNFSIPMHPHQSHYQSSLQTSHAQINQSLNLQNQHSQSQQIANNVAQTSSVAPKKRILQIVDPNTKAVLNLEGYFLNYF